MNDPARLRTILPVLLTLALLPGCSGQSGSSDATLPASDVADLPSDLEASACVCGNGLCEAACGETLAACPYDCKACGDGLCSPSEGPIACPTDCCGGCGDGTCRGYDCGESPASCKDDCGAACGDKVCGKGENPAGCAMDCAWQVCGNGVCELADGGATGCPVDCASGCGDCACAGDEDWQACPVDCGYCGDGVCSPCDRVHEDPATCPKDCGPVVGPGADVLEPLDVAGGDIPAPDAEVVPFVLAFADAHDDRGNPTAGRLVFFADVACDQARELRVRLTQGGEAVPDAPVTYEVQDDPQHLGALVASTVYTDASGIAAGGIRAAFAGSGEIGVTACAKGQPGAPCLEFRVAVDCVQSPVLTVGVAPPGSPSNITEARVFLYRRGTDGGPLCSDLSLDALPTATVASSWIAPGQTAVFPDLPGLEAEVEQVYTVVALGRTAEGAIDAWACNDQGAAVAWGASTQVDLVLAEIAPRIKGTYGVDSVFDLADGLPPDAATALYRVVNLLSSPATEAILAACSGGCVASDFCAYVFIDPLHPTIDGLTASGEVVLAVLAARTDAMAQASCPLGDTPACARVWWTGADVTRVLQKVGLIASLEFLAEPALAGTLVSASCEASWHSLRLWWTAGMSCPAADDACGAVTTPFGVIPGMSGPVAAAFGATVAPAWTLAIDPHEVDVKFGRIADYALESFLLPRLFGDASDGLPVVASYEALLGAVFGGRACLIDDTCCTVFAEDVAAQTTGLDPVMLAGACDAMRTCGAAGVRSLLADLDGADKGLALATQAGCPLYDSDPDGKFDGFGTAQAPCAWQASMKVGTSSFVPAGTFRGVRK
jgi:hypothetical protein